NHVVLIAGNRDINKLRLLRELNGAPPVKLLEEIARGESPPWNTRPELLRLIFTRTMGAHEAYEHRRTELIEEGASSSLSGVDVVDSWLEDVTSNGTITRYLSETVLAHREDGTLFLHGGVTLENLGVVPKWTGPRIMPIDSWIRALNDFILESVA